MKRKQHGYVDIDVGSLMALAACGLIAVLGGGIWLIWFLVSHLRWV